MNTAPTGWRLWLPVAWIALTLALSGCSTAPGGIGGTGVSDDGCPTGTRAESGQCKSIH